MRLCNSINPNKGKTCLCSKPHGHTEPHKCNHCESTWPVMRHWIVFVWGDVAPEIRGPYKTPELRLKAARRLKRINGDRAGIFWLESQERPVIGAYRGKDLDES